MHPSPDSDDLNLIDDPEDHGSAPVLVEPPWGVLIVDDDPEVHHATTFALRDVLIDGRPLRFIHASSASEALARIAADEDIAVVLLDVVMEHESAGLDLVRQIRQELGRSALRIVLRTGQPGYAPEMRVIREYDINDYKTKSELTRVRLLTTLTTAIRSYDQLRTIMNARRGLSLIVESAADLLTRRDPGDFAAGALDAASRLAGGARGALLCMRRRRTPGATREETLRIVGADGEFTELSGQAHDDTSIAGSIARRALAEGHDLFEGNDLAFFIAGDDGHDAVLQLRTKTPLPEADRQLLEVFCVNIGIGLENAGLIADLGFSAFTDRLTRLPNRAGFIARIDDHLRSGTRGWTVALLDLDHFSEFNDALGHHKGDQLLLSVTQRLCNTLSPGMVLARIGGDVFGLLGPDEQLDPRQLLDHFRMPFLVDEYSLPIKATLGLTRLDIARDSDGIDLLKTTNIALNRAKSGDRGRWHYYTEDMAQETRTRLDRLHDLRIAVTQQRGLELHYQPQIDLASGRLIGAEALIRWRGPDGNFIRPDQFISLAEYSGLIVDLGAWVFQTALRQLREWKGRGLDHIHMAINVSLVQFRDPHFLARLRSALDESGIPPERVELEITESVAMLEADTVIGILAELKAMGIQIAIDDFGTGFSSLAYLHRLPIDRLKIDRTFVRDLDANGSSGASIAQTVIGLGRSLGLSVIAEGVETEAQARLLMEMGCPLAQGFLYSRPVDAHSFLDWARARP